MIGRKEAQGKERRAFSATQIATRVATLGKEISRSYHGRQLDLVITLDRGLVFAADLMRQIDTNVICHFVREDVRDVEHAGRKRREVFFGTSFNLEGRDVLVVDAVLESGVTHEFLMRRIGESRPHSLRLAVLLDKPERRKVALEPDYFGFRTASNEIWVGYGLAAANGTGRNFSQLSSDANGQSSGAPKGEIKRRK